MKTIDLEPREVHVCPSSYGLFNRVKSILQLLSRTESGEPVHVEWKPSMHCPGTYHEVLQTIDNLIIHDDRYEPEEGWRTSLRMDKTHGWRQLVELLHVPDTIETNMKPFHTQCGGNYVAVHVRRTDLDDKKVANNEPVVSDRHYMDFVDKHVDEQPDTWLYVATDNRVTHEKFVNVYQDRVLNKTYHEPLQLRTRRGDAWKDSTKFRKRHTSLHDSMLDWIMCVTAKDFLGTSASTFTGVAMAARSHAKALRQKK